MLFRLVCQNVFCTDCLLSDMKCQVIDKFGQILSMCKNFQNNINLVTISTNYHHSHLNVKIISPSNSIIEIHLGSEYYE